MKNRKPVYLMAGGNWRNPKVLIPLIIRILSETKKSPPRVAYLGVANGDDASFFGMLENLFKACGVEELVFIRLARNRADVVKAKQALQAVDAIFVSGGDVEEGMRWLQQHQLEDYLRELHAKGILFFGLSAGSIMLGTQWVRWRDPNDENSAELFKCLGIAPILCDTHAEKDDWEELKTAVRLLGPGGVGFGIPSDGILRIETDGRLSALLKTSVYYENQDGRIQEIQDGRIRFEKSLE